MTQLESLTLIKSHSHKKLYLQSMIVMIKLETFTLFLMILSVMISTRLNRIKTLISLLKWQQKKTKRKMQENKRMMMLQSIHMEFPSLHKDLNLPRTGFHSSRS